LFSFKARCPCTLDRQRRNAALGSGFRATCFGPQPGAGGRIRKRLVACPRRARAGFSSPPPCRNRLEGPPRPVRGPSPPKAGVRNRSRRRRPVRFPPRVPPVEKSGPALSPRPRPDAERFASRPARGPVPRRPPGPLPPPARPRRNNTAGGPEDAFAACTAEFQATRPAPPSRGPTDRSRRRFSALGRAKRSRRSPGPHGPPPMPDCDRPPAPPPA